MMIYATYEAELFGEKYRVSADWIEASSPVLFDGFPTCYQTANFLHSPARAMRRLIEETITDSGGHITRSHNRDIKKAIKNMIVVDD
ncbi:MAG: hypothetical protein WC942_04540 [Clostridia bacterium]